MQFIRIFILLFSFSGVISSQNSATKAIDKHVNQVNDFLKTKSLVKKQADSLSILGGVLTSYALKNKLLLIKSHHGGEFGYVDYSYYLKNDSLVFIDEKKVSLKEPVTEKQYAEYERYVIFHTDKNGVVDYTQWPLGVNIHNTYYFKNNVIFKYELKNFKKIIKPEENEIQEINKNLLNRYETHLLELK
jgi:hypothetical protein